MPHSRWTSHFWHPGQLHGHGHARAVSRLLLTEAEAQSTLQSEVHANAIHVIKLNEMQARREICADFVCAVPCAVLSVAAVLCATPPPPPFRSILLLGVLRQLCENGGGRRQPTVVDGICAVVLRFGRNRIQQCLWDSLPVWTGVVFRSLCVAAPPWKR